MSVRRVIAAALCLIVVLSLAWYFVLWKPESSKLTHSNAALATAQGSESQLQLQVTSLLHDRAQLPKLKAELTRLQAALPSGVDLDSSIDEINQAATVSGATLLSLSPTVPSTSSGGTTAGPAGLTPIAIAIDVKGTYYQVMNFVYYLDKMPRLVSLTSLSVSSGGSGGVTGQVAGDMFYQAAPGPGDDNLHGGVMKLNIDPDSFIGKNRRAVIALAVVLLAVVLFLGGSKLLAKKHPTAAPPATTSTTAVTQTTTPGHPATKKANNGPTPNYTRNPFGGSTATSAP